MIVFAEDTALARRILDSNINYTIVGSAHIPLATRIAVAAAIANDKSLACSSCPRRSTRPRGRTS